MEYVQGGGISSTAQGKPSVSSEGRLLMEFQVPLAEVLADFYDQLKSRTQGYASMDYTMVDSRAAPLVKLEVLVNDQPVDAETEHARAVPVHHSFLSRGIPVYEQLFNVDELLNKENMYFVGVPLNIRGGDGMIVRPVVFVY